MNVSAHSIWQCGPHRLDLSRPSLMAILNVTPDSFSGGDLNENIETTIQTGLALLAAGADLIDVGGESTRPGAEPVALEEELRRVIPVIAGLSARTPSPISIDTMKAEVARQALAAGATIINDISAGSTDPDMFHVAAQAHAGLVLMHMQGTPQSMQLNPAYGNVVKEVGAYLHSRYEAACAAGVAPENIVLDPGFGFGKTFEHNLELFRRLPELIAALPRPLLLGFSRKAFLGRITGAPVQDRVLETASASALAVRAGIRLLRVHDVAAVRRAVLVAEALTLLG